MFWGFLFISGFAIGLIKLGAMSVWVSVLSAALKITVLIATLLAAFLMLRSLRRKQ